MGKFRKVPERILEWDHSAEIYATYGCFCSFSPTFPVAPGHWTVFAGGYRFAVFTRGDAPYP